MILFSKFLYSNLFLFSFKFLFLCFVCNVFLCWKCDNELTQGGLGSSHNRYVSSYNEYDHSCNHCSCDEIIIYLCILERKMNKISMSDWNIHYWEIEYKNFALWMFPSQIIRVLPHNCCVFVISICVLYSLLYCIFFSYGFTSPRSGIKATNILDLEVEGSESV